MGVRFPGAVREGYRFGNYELEELLAVGGMAEIFRARRLGAAGFVRRVCIKRILPALCSDASFVNMFIDEARTGALLRHGNIVAIDDFGEVDGRYYLCMELISGVDLARLHQRASSGGTPFPLDAAVFAAGEVLKALAYAHRKTGPDGVPLGIVHRDISPHNVLVSYAGEVKLTDFGIAKAASRLHQTVGQVIKGKLAYMAPEQMRGRPLDGRADLFALGVTLFEVLAGQKPFGGTNEGELVMAVLRGSRPRLRALRPDVPAALEAVVDRLLEPDVSKRYPNAGDALADLFDAAPAATGARTLALLMERLFPEYSSAPRALPATASEVTEATAHAHQSIPREESTATDPTVTQERTHVSNVLEATPLEEERAPSTQGRRQDPSNEAPITRPERKPALGVHESTEHAYKSAQDAHTNAPTEVMAKPLADAPEALGSETAMMIGPPAFEHEHGAHRITGDEAPSAIATRTMVAPLEAVSTTEITDPARAMPRESSSTASTRTMVAPVIEEHHGQDAHAETARMNEPRKLANVDAAALSLARRETERKERVIIALAIAILAIGGAALVLLLRS